jgi:hypothetical protein
MALGPAGLKRNNEENSIVGREVIFMFCSGKDGDLALNNFRSLCRLLIASDPFKTAADSGKELQLSHSAQC